MKNHTGMTLMTLLVAGVLVVGCGNGRHTVYFNDAETLRQRLQAAFERHPDLAGVAIWALGGEDPENWTIISQSDRKEDNRQ